MKIVLDIDIGDGIRKKLPSSRVLYPAMVSISSYMIFKEGKIHTFSTSAINIFPLTGTFQHSL